jgi:hypothetical protein
MTAWAFARAVLGPSSTATLLINRPRSTRQSEPPLTMDEWTSSGPTSPSTNSRRRQIVE